MAITYPDFAFNTSTQIVLFFVNVLVTTLSFFWGTRLILMIFQKWVSFGRKLLFNIICATGLQLLIVYGLAYLNGVVIHKTSQMYIGIFAHATSFVLPFAYFVLCWLGVRMLHLTKYQSMRIMRLLYAYFILNQLMLKVVGALVFPRIADPRGWNYLRDIFAITGGTALMYVPYRLAVQLIRKYKLYLEFPDNLVIRNAGHELLKNFGLSAVVYGVAMLCVYLPANKGNEYGFVAALMLCFMVISMMIEHIKADQIKLNNKDEHIAMLIGSIEEFRGVKHDFHNILQTYSGYLVTGDYVGLKRYHQKMINTTLSSEAGMEIGRRMREHPAFFSLIGAKLEVAKLKQVCFQINLPCTVEQMDMDSLDFCRVMGVLIDNAIEGAAETETRRVELSCHPRLDGGQLLILSNDVAVQVDSESIFQPGYTTKRGHAGQGLPQVRDILHRYGNCTFNVAHYKANFTVYFEIRPLAACRERVS